jgi:type IV pilus assembly protein PilC
MVFYYTGRASDGRRLQGSIEAVSRDAAAMHLRGRSVFITTLETLATVTGAWTFARLALRTTGARAVFFRSFAALLGAGVPVRRALDTTIQQSGTGSFGEILASIVAEIDAGSTLSSAFERHPNDFSPIAVAVLKAGERSGALDEAVRTLAELEERDRTLRRKVTAALAYPLVVSLAAGGLVAFLIANTIPAFAAMFAEMHVALPAGTRLLIATAAIVRNPNLWLGMSCTAIICTVALRGYKTSESAWASYLDIARLRVPLVGPIVVKSTVARFARTLGSLLRAGVDVVAALETAAGVVDGFTYRHGVRAIIDALRRGEALTAPFEATGLFDATFLQLVRAGEESGTLDDMLFRIASYYEADVETALSSLTSILEPVLICALGAAIGTIVASIIIPLYSMIGNIQ